MEWIIYWIFGITGILFAVYAAYRRQSNNLKSQQKRHEIQFPDVDYNYNRFNSKSERETEISLEGNQVYLKTDIQSIQVTNQVLICRISSEFEDNQFLIDVVVDPFEKFLFENDGYTNFNHDGTMIIWSYGNYTRFIFEENEDLELIYNLIPEDQGGVYVDLESYTADKSVNQVILEGKFDDSEEFQVIIDYKDYVLEMRAPLDSILKPKNIRIFDKPNSKFN